MDATSTSPRGARSTRSSWLPPGSTAGRFKSAREWSTTSSARCRHNAQHQSCLHVNGMQQPPTAVLAEDCLDSSPGGSVSNIMIPPRACVTRCSNDEIGGILWKTFVLYFRPNVRDVSHVMSEFWFFKLCLMIKVNLIQMSITGGHYIVVHQLVQLITSTASFFF
jgi:hypothetical protein